MNIEDHKCFLCNSRNETGKHLFVECREIKHVWRALSPEHVRQQLVECESMGAAMDILWHLTEKDRMLVVVMWCQWWPQRNKVREGEKPMDHSQFACRAACSMEEFQGCFSKNAKPHATLQRWLPPPVDVLKLNVDGAHTPGARSGAWGVIVRDCDGVVVAARAGRSDHVADAFGAELTAVHKALDVAAEIGAVRIIVETDALLVEQALNGRAWIFLSRHI